MMAMANASGLVRKAERNLWMSVIMHIKGAAGVSLGVKPPPGTWRMARWCCRFRQSCSRTPRVCELFEIQVMVALRNTALAHNVVIHHQLVLAPIHN
jgi:hypothetical protein